MNHVDDDAELYALGLTDPDRTAGIEAHLTGCEACRARVADAESVAASLAAALPRMPPAADVSAAATRRPWYAAFATAAALVFAVTAAFEASSAHAASEKLAATGTALTAIASSHFAHVTLSADSGTVVKAIYARDGTWCYIVAEHVPADARVRLFHGASAQDRGALASGAPATLFVRNAGRLDRIEIVSGGRVVAHGVPAY